MIVVISLHIEIENKLQMTIIKFKANLMCTSTIFMSAYFTQVRGILLDTRQ